MEQYRIETHLHTNHTSKCGWLDAAALAEGYAQAGYAAVAVTDHYNRDTFEYLDLDTTAPDDVMSHFLDGFRRMEAECARRLPPDGGGVRQTGPEGLQRRGAAL